MILRFFLVYPGKIRGCPRRTGRRSFDRLRLEVQLLLLQRNAQLLLQDADGPLRSAARLLLGVRVRDARLSPDLAGDAAHPVPQHLAHVVPQGLNALPRGVPRTVLRDVRPLLQQDRRQVRLAAVASSGPSEPSDDSNAGWTAETLSQTRRCGSQKNVEADSFAVGVRLTRTKQNTS